MLRERDARADDYRHFVGFWGELGIEQAAPDAARWEAYLRPDTLFLVDGGDVPQAYALIYPYGARGDVRQIVVAPAARRGGVGRQLMACVAARLRAAGCRDWRLEVRAENAPAIALYRGVGMELVHDVRVMRMTRAQAERFAAARASHTVVPVDAADDGALEAQFDYGAGQLARWRTIRPEARIWQLRERAGHAGGLTRYWREFTPDCGLLFPFRAGSAEAAAALMHGALSGDAAALPAEIELFAVDPAVTAAVTAAGARLHEHLLEMGGALPAR